MLFIVIGLLDRARNQLIHRMPFNSRLPDNCWKISFSRPFQIALVRKGEGLTMRVDGRVFSPSPISVPVQGKADIHVLPDTPKTAQRLRKNLIAQQCHVLGKRRLLSLDADKALYGMAAHIARSLRKHPPEKAQLPYFQQAVYGLMHAIAAYLRPLVEIREIAEQSGVVKITLPINRIASAFWLCDFLNKPAADYAGTRRWSEAPSRPLDNWPTIPRLVLITMTSRARPFGISAAGSIAHGLAEKFAMQIRNISPPTAFANFRKLRPQALVALYRKLRIHGHSRCGSLLLAGPAAQFENGVLPFLNKTAERFRAEAAETSDKVFVTTNLARLPALFALAGARAGGGATASIETTLVTQLDRYPSFIVDHRVVIDHGQARLLTKTEPSRVTACGSELIEARLASIERIASDNIRVVIASQPSDHEMRQIFALAQHLPHTFEIAVAPHAEDLEGGRAWLAGMVTDLNHPNVSLIEDGADPLNSATLIITATSNLAIVAQALNIPVILVVAARNLQDIWGDGPYPGLWFDPETDDPARFMAVVNQALAAQSSDYIRQNQALFAPRVIARIVTAFTQ